MSLLLGRAGQELGVLLTFLRFSAFFIAAPFPGMNVPRVARLVIAAGLAWSFGQEAAAPPAEVTLWTAVLGEVALGLSAGFLLTTTLQSFMLGGESVGQQMGLGVPGFFDPSSNTQLTLMGQLFGWIAASVFVLGDGPATLCTFLHRSLVLVPPGSAGALHGLEISVAAGRELFLVGLHAAAPLLTAVFAAQVLLAVLARTVPTLNLFVEGPAFTVSSGVLGLWASADTFLPLVGSSFHQRFESLLALLS